MSKNIENLNWLSLKEVKQRRKMLKSHIDEYTDYIEDYQQMCEAKRRNAELREDIRKVDIIIKELEDVLTELDKRNIVGATVRYAKGNIQLIWNGRTLYRKVKF